MKRHEEAEAPLAVVPAGRGGLMLPEHCVFGCRFALRILPWIIRLGPIGPLS